MSASSPIPRFPHAPADFSALGDEAARLRALLGMAAGWYWTTDASHRAEGRTGAGATFHFALPVTVAENGK